MQQNYSNSTINHNMYRVHTDTNSTSKTSVFMDPNETLSQKLLSNGTIKSIGFGGTVNCNFVFKKFCNTTITRKTMHST